MIKYAVFVMGNRGWEEHLFYDRVQAKHFAEKYKTSAVVPQTEPF